MYFIMSLNSTEAFITVPDDDQSLYVIYNYWRVSFSEKATRDLTLAVKAADRRPWGEVTPLYSHALSYTHFVYASQ